MNHPVGGRHGGAVGGTMDLKRLGRIELDKGGHASPADGLCAMEAVALLEGLAHGTRPDCTCPVVAAFVRRANDRLPDDQRQRLVPYLPRLVGTVCADAMAPRTAWLVGYAVQTAVAEMLCAIGLAEQGGRLTALREGSWSAAADTLLAIETSTPGLDGAALKAVSWGRDSCKWTQGGALEWAAAGSASCLVWAASAQHDHRAWERLFDALEGLLALGPSGGHAATPARRVRAVRLAVSG